MKRIFFVFLLPSIAFLASSCGKEEEPFFSVDNSAPVIVEVTAVTTPTNDNTPNYTFSSDEKGTIIYGGSCRSSTTSAVSGNNAITFNTLSDGTYSDCTITVTDKAANESNLLTLTSFLVDSTASTLVETKTITSSTNDDTPDYTFVSSEAGTITYSGSCSSSTTSASAGTNTITFNALSDGTYSDCKITVTDSLGNAVTLNIGSFVIDRTAPAVSSINPTNNQTGVSKSSNISVTFSKEMDTTTITTNTSNTTCSGSFSLSSDNFSNCVQMASSPSSSNSDKTFTLDPSDNLTAGTTYKTRVTTGVKDTPGNALSSQYETSNGFTTASSATTIALGPNHTCMLDNGTVKCWGYNYWGQLGIDNNTNMGDNSSEMAQLTGINLGTGRIAKAISPGYHHNCAILDNASVKCWGYNNYGQLGIDSTATMGDAAGEMAQLSGINLGTGRTATAIDAGQEHACAILDNASVKCWGYNNYGQLGIGSTTNMGDNSGEMAQLTGINLGTGRTATAIAVGRYHSCALLDNASVKCWGLNNGGQLGLEDTNNRGDNSNEMGDNLHVVDLGSGRTATAIAAGHAHTCAILDNASVKCWGLNNKGQLGIDSTTTMGDAAGEMAQLKGINLGTGRTATAIASRFYHTCALLDNASVKCWGYNNYGQLGIGSTTNMGDNSGEMAQLKGINLGTGRTATALDAGQEHTCALLDDASVKCWGYNNVGQLGIDSTATMGDAAGEMGDNLPSVNL